MSDGARLHVLVADDSRTARALLVGILEADPTIRVVAEAVDGVEAVELSRRLHPSIVIMDIEMPNMNGFEATKRIMIDVPTPIIVVSARYEPDHVEFGLQALRAGALAILPKPAGPSAPGFAEQATRMVSLVKALSQVKVVRQRGFRNGASMAGTDTGDTTDTSPRRAPRRLAIVGVAASTGGPAALYRFLEMLPRTVDIPVLVVQHISEGFVAGLAKWLGGSTVLPVCVAEDGQDLTGGQVYVAPDDRHMEVGKGRILLSRESPLDKFRPSANVLFASLARAYGPEAAAVVLTGMGTDGVEGAKLLHQRGGLILAQDASTSVVYGMPRAVAEEGVTDTIGTVEHLARRIIEMAPMKGPTR